MTYHRPLFTGNVLKMLISGKIISIILIFYGGMIFIEVEARNNSSPERKSRAILGKSTDVDQIFTRRLELNLAITCFGTIP